MIMSALYDVQWNFIQMNAWVAEHTHVIKKNLSLAPLIPAKRNKRYGSSFFKN